MNDPPADSSGTRVVVRGRVQGVGFRAWTQHQAELHGLSGWVRNLRDGSLEAVFCGPRDTVAIVVRGLRDGPRGARVEAVEEYPASVEESAAAPEGRFAVRETF